jgi:hypothetical protein
MQSELELRSVTMFVDHSGDHRFSADGSQIGYVPDRLRLDVRRQLLPRLMRPVAAVMDHVLAEHQDQDQVTFESSKMTPFRFHSS